MSLRTPSPCPGSAPQLGRTTLRPTGCRARAEWAVIEGNSSGYPHQSTDTGAAIARATVPATFLLATLAALELDGLRLENL